MPLNLRKGGNQMPTYTHGGDLLTAQTQYGGPVLDFSANLNPLGMPESVRQAAAAAVTEAIHYPDPLCRTLRAGIAVRDGVRAEQVICGNGAADVLFRLVQAKAPRRALVTAPTFSEYEQALRSVNCHVKHHYLKPERNFDVTEAILKGITPGLDMVFLCTPNNPTGRMIAPDLLNSILHRCEELDILLAVDECFLALSDWGDSSGMAPCLSESKRLFLLRAFTKSYAIPGLRLGYGLSGDKALLEKMSAVGQPWPVSGPAQAAGAACLQAADWPGRARKLIQTERAWLLDQLRVRHLTVWEGQANYLLFRAPGRTDLKALLLERGILVRSCANYVGLGEDYYRAAVRPRAENERLIQALDDILGGNI